MPEPALSTAEPNHDTPCMVCGQKPTVDILKPGQPMEHTALCGPCCFGEAACIDPDEW